MIMGVTPEISEVDTPANILWENLGVSGKERRIRLCISWTAAIILLIAALIGTIIIMNRGKALLTEYNTKVDCPAPKTINTFFYKYDAVIDQSKSAADREGLMTCFC